MTPQVKLAAWAGVWTTIFAVWYFCSNQDNDILTFISIFALFSFFKFVIGIKPRKVKRNRLKDAIKRNNLYDY